MSEVVRVGCDAKSADRALYMQDPGANDVHILESEGNGTASKVMSSAFTHMYWVSVYDIVGPQRAPLNLRNLSVVRSVVSSLGMTPIGCRHRMFASISSSTPDHSWIVPRRHREAHIREFDLGRDGIMR